MKLPPLEKSTVMIMKFLNWTFENNTKDWQTFQRLWNSGFFEKNEAAKKPEEKKAAKKPEEKKAAKKPRKPASKGYRRQYYKAHREKLIEASIRSHAKRKAKEKAAKEKAAE